MNTNIHHLASDYCVQLSSDFLVTVLYRFSGGTDEEKLAIMRELNHRRDHGSRRPGGSFGYPVDVGG
jgi:hypothetical protein